MKPASEFQIIRPGLAFWQAYDPAVKTDLCCCAIEMPRGLVFCDPVPLDPLALEELLDGRALHAILLTNANHERDAPSLARRYGIEVWAHSGAQGQVTASRWFEDGDMLFGGVEAVSLEGFGVGETAFWWEGVLILGDALIHAPPYGFSILPDKYCADPKAGREALKKLAHLPVEILTFAHGLPIVSHAGERLASTLEGGNQG